MKIFGENKIFDHTEKIRKKAGYSKSSGPLFLNYRGGRLSARSVNRIVKRYIEIPFDTKVIVIEVTEVYTDIRNELD